MAIKRYSLSRLQQFLYIGLTIGALLSFIISNMIDTTTHILLAPVDTELNATAMETHLHAVSYINYSIVTPQEDTVMETQSEPNSSVVNSQLEVTTMNIESASNVSNSSTDTTQSIHELFIDRIKNYRSHSFMNHFVVDKRHKLLYCNIPKNSCTKFKTLFLTMTNRFAPSHMRQHMVGKNIHTEALNYQEGKHFLTSKILHDTEWRTLLVVRDPLERLLSGFLNKCLRFDFCEGSELTRDQFKVFAKRVYRKVRNNRKSGFYNHYWPQHRFCGLPFIYPQFIDFTIYYDTNTIGDSTLRFLQAVNLEQYYYHWGKYGNETLFDSFTSHSTKQKVHSLNDSVSFYQEFYDKELVELGLTAFRKDYELFNLTNPLWIEYIQ